MGVVLNISAPALDHVLYGDKSQVVGNYLANQLQNLPPAFNDLSQRVYGAIQNSYNYVTDKLTQYGILNQLQEAGVQGVANYYTGLYSFQQLQEANLTMQRWVMSHPGVRDLYLEQNIDGYSESYNNVFGDGVGVEDYNYRRVMDGVPYDHDTRFTVTHYVEDLLSGDRELDHYEKSLILHTYDTIDWLIQEGDFDFTVDSEAPPKINK